MTDFPSRIGFPQAIAITREVALQARLPMERLPPSRAHDRILARDLVAAIPLPGFDNSAMDGFAFRHADLTPGGPASLRLVGTQFAGRALGLRVGAGECVRITTGAAMPEGADTVVMKENTQLHGEHVAVAVQPKPHQHVRRAGEDVHPGDRVLQAGCVMTPPRVALASALGVDGLEVSQRPTVAVFTTGDELVEPGMPLQRGEIYNSNRELLMGLLRADGLEPTAWPTLPDEPARIEGMLRDAAASFDIVITCGAVSAGEKDHVPALMQRHAAAGSGRIHFWKVRMKPGMPVLQGRIGRAQFLGLPGNPVSVLATWLTFGRALIDGMQGRAEARPRLHARLDGGWSKTHERLEFLRGRLQSAGNGVLRVQPNPADGSHRMRGAADSDALVVLDEGMRDYARDDVVEVLPY